MKPRASPLDEYQARRENMLPSAKAHWRLAIWCKQNGLEAESIEHLRAVVRLNPAHEAAWRRLGYKKFRGRWRTDAQIAAEKREIEARAKANRDWPSLVNTWKSWLTDRSKRPEAQRRLAALSEPRAVPAVWRAFATGTAAEQAVAVQVFGQIDSTYATRALAVLAVFGNSAYVRRAATETIAGRDPRQFADLLIGLMRDPIKYQAYSVRGPGLPGALIVEGPQVNLRRVYAPPPAPSLPIFPGENISFDAQGLPIIVRHTDEVELPFFWMYQGYVFRDGNAVPAHIPATIAIGRMWLENWKSVQSAREQLGSDVAALENRNRVVRAANAQLAQVLNQATRQNLPGEPAAWRDWWSIGSGNGRSPSLPPQRPTVDEILLPAYLPRRVQGIGYDPLSGYYLWGIPRF